MIQIVRPLVLITTCSQLFALLFFSLVGKFEGVGEDTFLKESESIFSLASTITMCIIGIMGAIYISKFVVVHYLSPAKERTFLFPVSRKKLYQNKIQAFAWLFLLTTSVSMILANILFLPINSLLNIFDFNFVVLFRAMLLPIACACIAFAVVLLSQLVGLKKESQLMVLVSAITLVVVVANVVAISFINFPMIGISASPIVLAFVLIINNTNHAFLEKEY
jgi:hypothetical protein